MRYQINQKILTPPLGIKIKNIIRNQLRLGISRYPKLYFIFKDILYGYSKDLRLVNKSTDILIDGFPSSANSFAVRAFRLSQNRELVISHHLHDPAQIIAATNANIPTIVLIREPQQTIVSNLVRFKNYWINQANTKDIDKLILTEFKRYVFFYSLLRDYKGSFIIADFNEVTSDFNKIIVKLNQKYNTNFSHFVHNDENVQKCFNAIENNTTAFRDMPVSDINISRPTKSKEFYKDIIKNQLSVLEDRNELKKATEIYIEFTSVIRAGF